MNKKKIRSRLVPREDRETARCQESKVEGSQARHLVGSGGSQESRQLWKIQDVLKDSGRPFVPGQSGHQPGCFFPGSPLYRIKNYFQTLFVLDKAKGIDVS